MVLGWDHATDDDQDVRPTQSRQGLTELGHQGEVACGQGADADDMDIVLHGLSCGLLRGLEQGADVDIEAQIRERGGGGA